MIDPSPEVDASWPVPARRWARLLTASAVAIVVAGFWNVQFVDGLGLAVFVTPTIGPFEGKAAAYDSLGPLFGLGFAIVTGLATTWTASNGASLTMVPLLVVTAAGRRATAWQMATVAASAAAMVGAIYGVFVGRLGPEGAAAFNVSSIRSAQSFAVFGAVGVALLVWAAAEARLVPDRWRPSSDARALLSRPAATAGLCGVMIGAFSMGRPLAVFREFLLFTAQPNRVTYGALAMGLEAIATTAGALTLTLLLTSVGGHRLADWIRRLPARARLLSATGLAAGGTFLIFYWGVTRVFPVLARWGFRLGIYDSPP